MMHDPDIQWAGDWADDEALWVDYIQHRKPYPIKEFRQFLDYDFYPGTLIPLEAIAMRQVDFEARADWNELALRVPCPIPSAGGCGVPIGKMCIELSMATPKSRVDYHVARKAAAMAKFEQEARDAVNRDTGSGENSEAGSPGLCPSAVGDDTAGVGSNVQHDLPTPADGPVQGNMPGFGGSVERKDDGHAGDHGIKEDDQLRPVDRSQEVGGDTVVGQDNQ